MRGHTMPIRRSHERLRKKRVDAYAEKASHFDIRCHLKVRRSRVVRDKEVALEPGEGRWKKVGASQHV